MHSVVTAPASASPAPSRSTTSEPTLPSSPAGRRIAAMLATLGGPHGAAAGLSGLARAQGLSPFHLQRLFRRWVGLSPQQFAAFARISHAKGLLTASRDVLDVALSLGMSGPGRLHDQFVRIEAMSPGEYKRQGAQVAIRFGSGATPLGPALAAWTPRGVCAVQFGPELTQAGPAEAWLQARWPRATLLRDPAAAQALLTRIFSPAPRDGRHTALRVLVQGTRFQVAVWQGLLAIPAGDVTTYGRLAAWCGAPGAARAVGAALGANPVALLIPCHRVIQESGLLGGYRWGQERKIALLARELSAAHSAGRSG